MQAFRITGAADLRRIEQQAYAGFMAPTHLLAALEEAARRHGDRPALSFIESADLAVPAQRWTHREFVAEVRRAANLFTQLAGDQPPRVAMLLPAVPQAHFTLWGGEAAGVVCPINPLLGSEHIAELLRACNANILVALGPHAELDIWPRVAGLRAACPALRQVLAVGGADGAIDFDAALAAMPGDVLRFDRRPGAETVAALFHTGGTTGAPKLAQHTHGNQLHASWGAAQMLAIGADDVMLNGFPLFHVAGAFVYGLSTLLAGGELVLPTLLGLRNAPFVKRYWQFVQRHRVSLLAAVPTVMATLLALERGSADLGSVRALLTGGSPLPTELAAAFERVHGVPVRNILGMTECAGVISIEPFHAPRTPGSCGLPLPFTEVQASRADGVLCRPGETGVLRVRGPNVGPGYTDTRRNAGTFAEGGWLVTGDIGHVDHQGRVFVTGRAKDVIIRSSHNIDPGVIEDALLAHPDVQLAAAVGEPDEYAGELPVAFVVLKPGASIGAAALLAFVAPRIPERAAVPRRIELLPALPLTAIGKVYKPALRARAIERVLAERLQTAHLPEVGLSVEDQPRGLLVCFRGAVPHRPAIAALMQGFALDYRIEAAP
jgi:fatty-acyl-CoA synthase